jgi:hypothetical protein
MANAMPRNRKWERYGCLLPCHVIPEKDADLSISARIINIGRGGILIESDYSFDTGTRVIIAAGPDMESDKFDELEEIHGTVRWGQIDRSSLMGLFYVGIEFDDLLPLKNVVSGHEPS